MNHSDFYIGMEFFYRRREVAVHRYRLARCCSHFLGAAEMVNMHYDENKERHEQRFISTDPRDLSGPPYGVIEHVFDEYDLEGCYARPDEV